MGQQIISCIFMRRFHLMNWLCLMYISLHLFLYKLRLFLCRLLLITLLYLDLLGLDDLSNSLLSSLTVLIQCYRSRCNHLSAVW